MFLELPEEVWTMLKAWYGLQPNHPEILRETIAIGLRQEVRVELYPHILDLSEATGDTSERKLDTLLPFSKHSNFNVLLEAQKDNKNSEGRVWIQASLLPESLRPTHVDPEQTGGYALLTADMHNTKLDAYNFESLLLPVLLDWKRDGEWTKSEVRACTHTSSQCP